MKTTYYKCYSPSKNAVTEHTYCDKKDCEAECKRLGGDWEVSRHGMYTEDKVKKDEVLQDVLEKW